MLEGPYHSINRELHYILWWKGMVETVGVSLKRKNKVIKGWLPLVITLSKLNFYKDAKRCYKHLTAQDLFFAESAKKASQNIVLFSIMNESGRMTQSLTSVLTCRDAARLKRTAAFMGEWRVGGEFWEFHFSSLAILAHPPTTNVEYSEPWMSAEKTSTHTSSYSKEAPRRDNVFRRAVTLLSWSTPWGKKQKIWSGSDFCCIWIPLFRRKARSFTPPRPITRGIVNTQQMEYKCFSKEL